MPFLEHFRNSEFSCTAIRSHSIKTKVPRLPSIPLGLHPEWAGKRPERALLYTATFSVSRSLYEKDGGGVGSARRSSPSGVAAAPFRVVPQRTNLHRLLEPRSLPHSQLGVHVLACCSSTGKLLRHWLGRNIRSAPIGWHAAHTPAGASVEETGLLHKFCNEIGAERGAG